MVLPSRSWRVISKPDRVTDSREKLIAALQHDVGVLACHIGERNTAKYGNLDLAATFIENGLQSAGVPVCRQTYTVRGRPCHNVVGELPGIGVAMRLFLSGRTTIQCGVAQARTTMPAVSRPSWHSRWTAID